VFKKDEMITNYKIIDNQKDIDSNIMNDLHMIGDAINNTKNGLGYQTTKTINIQDM